VGELVTIDGKLEKFRGNYPFRQCIASKPGKYGIKIYALVDSRSFYTQNLEIYVGKQPEGQYQLSNSPADVVERMISPISGSGRNVTVDNWFTGVLLAMKLLKDHNLRLLGTIRKNKKEIPPQLVQTKNKAINTSIFCFRKEMTMVSYVPKKGKVVLLVSTMHNDDKIYETTQELRKPEIITTYNLTKGGVDTVDQLCATYDVSRNSRRWPLTVFCALLNVAGINAQVIFANNIETR
jgi:hypothetical protein